MMVFFSIFIDFSNSALKDIHHFLRSSYIFIIMRVIFIYCLSVE